MAGLGEGADKREIEETFMKFGRLKHVWVSRRPAESANVFFEKEEDAKMAVKSLNGVLVLLLVIDIIIIINSN